MDESNSMDEGPPPYSLQREVFYVGIGLFRKYYRIVKYGNFNFNSALFITPKKVWYTIEPARGEEAFDIREPDTLVVYGREYPCPGRVIPSGTLSRLIAQMAGRAFILLVPRKPLKMPKIPPEYSYLGHELAQIAAAPALISIFDGSSTKPISIFDVRPRCLVSLTTALGALEAVGIEWREKRRKTNNKKGSA